MFGLFGLGEIFKMRLNNVPLTLEWSAMASALGQVGSHTHSRVRLPLMMNQPLTLAWCAVASAFWVIRQHALVTAFGKAIILPTLFEVSRKKRE